MKTIARQAGQAYTALTTGRLCLKSDGIPY